MKLIQYICKFSNVQHGLATVKSAPHEIVIIIKKNVKLNHKQSGLFKIIIRQQWQWGY